jgi:ribonucleoside-diphosphate reductase alpha chain
MIVLGQNSVKLEEIEPAISVNEPKTPNATPQESLAASGTDPNQGELPLPVPQIGARPDVVEAKVYRLRSAFVKHNVYITLGWVKLDDRIRPIEIFFNSKDLTRSPEYAILTRLISAIFRKSDNPAFLLEELRGIHDPNGGAFKNGRYMHSFYAEVADVIETFFYDVGVLKHRVGEFADQNQTASMESRPQEEAVIAFDSAPGLSPKVDVARMNQQFKICPDCQQKTLKMENGCDVCVGCGYSKCDK